MECPATFNKIFASIANYQHYHANLKLSSKRLRSREYQLDKRKLLQQNEGLLTQAVHGDVLMFRIRDYLNKMPVERHEDQVRFHNEFLRAVAPGLYGAQFEQEYPRILKENGWESVRPQAMVITPRRWGKTYCVAMFATAYLMAVPGNVQCIFSTSARISQMILDLIFRFLISFIGMQQKIVSHTKEYIWIQGDTPGDIRKIFSYPSNEKIWARLSFYC